MLDKNIKKILEDNINEAVVEVTGDGSKYTVKIISDVFTGKSKLARHKIIYSYLNKYIQSGEIHALTIISMTKNEISDYS
ncbi:MAG: hypothetical protein CMD88_03965 [Gammaproteobacteria bacterium]|nr:hypothetical protein [Gammaproteobacteria bacterium]|tara:strand:+ start:206 stop:445 length:240 start_codon:yes stop_codon:yes gene_type:complete